MLDRIDRRIIEILQMEGKIKNAELAKKVNLSVTPCVKRVKKLESLGVISGYKAVVDPKKAGLSISSLVLLKLENNTRTAVDEFSEAVRGTASITECYLTTGRTDYIARVYARDFDHYESIVKDDLAELPHLDSMETLFLFSNIKPDAHIKFEV